MSASAAPTLDALLTPRKSVVRWNDEEWDDIAKRVWKKRARDPKTNLITIVNCVQKQDDWPKDRVRLIRTMNEVKPLLQRLHKIDMDMLDAVDRELPALKQTVAEIKKPPTKEEIIGQMPEEEICRRFRNVVLAGMSPAEIVRSNKPDELLSLLDAGDIFRFLGDTIFTELASLREQVTQVGTRVTQLYEVKTTNGNGKHPERKPRIAVLGIQQHQVPAVTQYAGGRAEIIYVARTAESLEGIIADHVVVWRTHCNDALRRAAHEVYRNDQITEHGGSWGKLLDRVAALPMLRSKPR